MRAADEVTFTYTPPEGQTIQSVSLRGSMNGWGETPMAQGDGRDHHIKAFSLWMAGGGIKAGTTWGATDELGYDVARDPVSVHDLHATMLHLLGIDHHRFSKKFQGLDMRLTGVEPAHVIKNVLA